MGMLRRKQAIGGTTPKGCTKANKKLEGT